MAVNDLNVSAVLPHKLFHYMCGRVSAFFGFGKAEGRTARIDLALAELWRWEVHYARWIWSSSPQDLSMGGVDLFIDDYTPLFCLSKHRPPHLFLFPKPSPLQPYPNPAVWTCEVRLVTDRWKNLSSKHSWCACAALRSQEPTGCRRNAASGAQTRDPWAALLHSCKVEHHYFLIIKSAYAA